MAVFKCKMCGGALEFESGATVGVCGYCGTKQTLPRLDGDRKANLYDRADHFRRNNDFDKAAGIYEQILAEDNTDAETYWLLVLCRYGIEYVEDPATHKRVPTVTRAQYTSIFDDADYRSALEYADTQQRAIYEAEAAAINEIQKGILAISQKEEPFDVFICYKETDAQGRRTPDSVLANDLYHQLVNEGYKVFFSRITLEDKLGQEYEPYIFAALNSAKVMVVLGTKPEYFNAVWVKNEWSRYLALVKASNGKKTLIPAYRDMDPYDLPEEFSHLQAQDMSKLGFMQDLLRGIQKLTAKEDPQPKVKETVVREPVSPGGVNVTALLKRAFMFLEDSDWTSADEYCEKVLDQEPENAWAYLGKLMAEQHARTTEALANCDLPFDKSSNYQKVIRFGEEKLSALLKSYIAHINERNENNRLNGIYNEAVSKMNCAESEAAFNEAADKFSLISGFKDADTLVKQCREKATRKRLELERQIEQEKIAAKKAAKKRKRKKAIGFFAFMISVIFIVFLTKTIIFNNKMKEAMAYFNSENYDLAYTLLVELKNTKKTVPIKYDCAVALINSEEYDYAYTLLVGLNYEDSAEKASAIKIPYVKAVLSKAEAGATFFFGSYEQDNDFSNGKEDVEWQVLKKEDDRALVISRDALDSQQYHAEDANVAWETCSLRGWMNDTFINNMFSSEEQNLIQTATVSASDNPSYITPEGNDTQDRMFLLNITEAKDYFGYDKDRKCKATEYAIAQGAMFNGKYCFWSLRSYGDREDTFAFVDNEGYINRYGTFVNQMHYAIRPAMWIDFS